MSNEAMSKIMNSYTNSASTAARLYGCPQALFLAPKGGPEAQALTPRGLLQGVSGLHKGVRVVFVGVRIVQTKTYGERRATYTSRTRAQWGGSRLRPTRSPLPQWEDESRSVCVWCVGPAAC